MQQDRARISALETRVGKMRARVTLKKTWLNLRVKIFYILDLILLSLAFLDIYQEMMMIGDFSCRCVSLHVLYVDWVASSISVEGTIKKNPETN